MVEIVKWGQVEQAKEGGRERREAAKSVQGTRTEGVSK